MSLVQKLAEQGFPWMTVSERHSQFRLRSAKRVGELVFVSGQIPIKKNGTVVAGRVGDDVTPSQAADAARICAAWSLFAASTAVGPEGVTGVASMTVFIRCASGFNETSRVAEGASELFEAVLGDAGVGTRAAVGVAELPADAVVEISVVFTAR